MTSNILLTREQNKSLELLNLLTKAGFKTFSEPLFLTKNVSNIKLKGLKQPSFVIITSQNACNGLLKSGISKDIKIYAVGKKTARSLENLGFNQVVFPEVSSAKALKEMILAQEKPSCGAYFHGSIISLDFAAELKAAGFLIEKIQSYKIYRKNNFSKELLDFSKTEFFAKVLIFSQNSAKIFLDLAKKHNLLAYFKQSQILCMSEKILLEIKNSGFENAAIFSDFPILKEIYGRVGEPTNTK